MRKVQKVTAGLNPDSLSVGLNFLPCDNRAVLKLFTFHITKQMLRLLFLYLIFNSTSRCYTPVFNIFEILQKRQKTDYFLYYLKLRKMKPNINKRK